jgi:hypothetical protein
MGSIEAFSNTKDKAKSRKSQNSIPVSEVPSMDHERKQRVKIPTPLTQRFQLIDHAFQ